jgi:hypothetical protein
VACGGGTATHEYYDAEEVAKKVLPCLSMLAVDIEKYSTPPPTSP